MEDPELKPVFEYLDWLNQTILTLEDLLELEARKRGSIWKLGRAFHKSEKQVKDMAHHGFLKLEDAKRVLSS